MRGGGGERIREWEHEYNSGGIHSKKPGEGMGSSVMQLEKRGQELG